ncbi:MAG: type 1 glutamine amidotransferase, partial [Mycobacteriales bacterium]
ICLGAQLLAVACGGEVCLGTAGPERGAALVRKSDIAGRDPVFVDVPLLADVVQWHGEEISRLPEGATLLAAGSRYRHQAFRVGERAYGVQFHVEATPDMVANWARLDGLDPADLLPAVEKLDLAATWRSAMERFAALAR